LKAALRQTWPARLDKTCAICGALVPAGIVTGNAGFEGAVAVAVLAWIIRCSFTPKRVWYGLASHPLTLPLFFWHLSIVLSLLVNGPGSKGALHDIAFIRYLLFSFAILDLSRRLPVSRYLLFGLAGGVVWAAMNTAWAHLWGADLIGRPLIRYSGKLKEAARIAGLTAYAAPFFLTWAVRDRHLKPAVKAMIAVLGMMALILVFKTQVRTAILAAGAGICFAVVWFYRKGWKPAAILLLIAALVGAGAYVIQGEKLWWLRSIYDRFFYWKVAWAMWQDHPVFGVGVSSFQDAYRQMAASGRLAPYIAPDGEIFALANVYHAHNMFLMIGSCTGLMGFLAFFWLVAKAAYCAVRNTASYRMGFVPWPVVLLTIGLTGFNMFHGWYQGLFIFLLVLIGSGSGVGAGAISSGSKAAMVRKQLTVVQMLPELESGGVERGTLEMGRYLAEHGHTSIVISGGGRMVDQLTAEGSVHYFWRVGEKSLRCLLYLLPLRRLLIEKQVDILHVRSRLPAWIGYLVWRTLPASRRPRLVSTFHGFHSINAYSAIMAKGEKVIAVSGAITEHIQQAYGICPDKIVQIYRGFDEAVFHPEVVSKQRVEVLKTKWGLPDPLPPVIMLPARLTRLKGHALFFASLSRIIRLPWIAVCVGDTRENPAAAQRLTRQLAEQNLKERVKLVGHCSDMPAALMLADIVVSASIEPEACSRVMLEAQAMGKMVVASAHGGTLETIRDSYTGFLVTPGHSRHLAQALAKAIGDPQLRSRYGQNGRYWVRERFTVKKMCRKTVALYYALLNRDAV
jgi:glycosyltransferase involved in cell wall biosynthesis/O-antigen ligase